MAYDITATAPSTIATNTEAIPLGLVALTDSKAIVAYKETNAGYSKVRVISVAGGAVTSMGTAVDLVAATYVSVRITRMTDTSAMVAYYSSTLAQGWVRMLTITGEVISLGATTGYTASFSDLVRMSATKALVFSQSSPSAPTKVRVVNEAATVLSLGASTYDVTTTHSLAKNAFISGDDVLSVYQEFGVGTYRGEILNVAGDVVTVTNTVTDIDTNAWSMAGKASPVSPTKAVCVYGDDTTKVLKAKPLTISGSGFTVGATLSALGTVQNSDRYTSVAIPSTENVLVAYSDSTATNTMKVRFVAAAATEAGTVLTVGAGSTDVYPTLSALSSSQAILVFQNASTGMTARVLSFDPPVVEGVIVPTPLPALTANLYGNYALQATLPAFTARMTGGPRRNALEPTLPMLTATMRAGARLPVQLPMLSANMTGTTNFFATINATLPMVTANLSGTTGRLGGITATLPTLMAAMRGGGTARVELPMITVSMTGATGTRATITALLPMLTADMSATAQAYAIIEAVLPMLVPSQSGRIVAMLPMLEASIAGQFTVAVTYEAYAINLNPSNKQRTNEVTHYTNMPFTGIVRWQGNNYGWGPGGLYLIGGATDDGAAIPWTWHTAITNFGSRQQKALRETFLHGRLGPTVSASVSIGEAADVTYAAAIERGRSAQAHRVKYGRGLKAEYWSFGLADAAGSDMEIDSMQHEPQPLSRKI